MESWLKNLGFSTQSRFNQMSSINGENPGEIGELSEETKKTVFEPRPGTTANTDCMYQYAYALYCDPKATETEHKQAVEIFEEAASRGHIAAMYQLTVIYTEQSSKSFLFRSYNQARANYYKDCAVALLTEENAEFILSQSNCSSKNLSLADGVTNAVTELYAKCAAYLNNQSIRENLPLEQWHSILGSLCTNDRLYLAQTCTTFASMVRPFYPSITLNFSTLTKKNEAQFCQYLRSLSGEKLNIKIERNVNPSIFKKSFQLFCAILSGNKKIKAIKLDVSRCGLTRTEAPDLAKLTNLTSLDVSHNLLCDPGAQALTPLTSLRSLDISWNNLGPAGAQALTALTNLRVLDISDNYLATAGRQALTPLTNLTSLKFHRDCYDRETPYPH